jgi:hypothetical protein
VTLVDLLDYLLGFGEGTNRRWQVLLTQLQAFSARYENVRTDMNMNVLLREEMFLKLV